MRLTCPNCAAQYEVEDDVIPAAGRDVQCSNCGHTWFQVPNTRPVTKPVSTPVEPEPEAPVADEPDPVDETPVEAEVEEEEFTKPAVSDDVASVLREEAERELSERKTERQSGGLEMQPELGGMDSDIAETPANFTESEAVLDEAAAAAIAGTGAKRKDMLPDIEEINSTLSSDEPEKPQPDRAEVEATRRSGFRLGFLLIMAIFIIMVLAYAFAPNIVQMNPQTTEMMSSYVDWVNNLRASLDSTLSGIAERLSALVE